MPLKISIPSSESSKDLSTDSSLYNHARSPHFPAQLSFYLNSLLTLEPDVLQEKLANIRRLVPIDIHTHFGSCHDNKNVQRGQIQSKDIVIETDHDKALYQDNSTPTQTIHTLERRTSAGHGPDTDQLPSNPSGFEGERTNF